MREDEWKMNFRLSKIDFFKLVDMIRPYARKRSSKVRKDVLSLEKRVAITLHYLKDQGSMRMTANVFGIARCTVGQVVQEICSVITKNLGPQLIKFPKSKEDVSACTADFLQRNSGTHLRVQQFYISCLSALRHHEDHHVQHAVRSQASH